MTGRLPGAPPEPRPGPAGPVLGPRDHTLRNLGVAAVSFGIAWGLLASFFDYMLEPGMSLRVFAGGFGFGALFGLMVESLNLTSASKADKERA